MSDSLLAAALQTESISAQKQLLTKLYAFVDRGLGYLRGLHDVGDVAEANAVRSDADADASALLAAFGVEPTIPAAARPVSMVCTLTSKRTHVLSPALSQALNTVHCKNIFHFIPVSTHVSSLTGQTLSARYRYYRADASCQRGPSPFG